MWAALAVILLMLFIGRAHAEVRITNDPGGRIVEYAGHFLAIRRSGERVVIDGTCLSACTLALGLLPRRQLCATGNAVLGFHAAWQPDGSGGRVTSSEGTRTLLEIYPKSIRAWIARTGGLTPRMKYLRGAELRRYVSSCGRPEMRHASNGLETRKAANGRASR